MTDEHLIQPKLTEQEAIIAGLMREETQRVVLLFSAGADSTATGLKLIEDGFDIYPLFIDYGQSAADAEMHLAKNHAVELGFEEPVILELAKVMLFLSDSALLGGEATDDAAAWVPARNTIFMILAGSYAYQIDADGIAVGLMAEDQGVFGDSNLEHHALIQALLSKSLSRQMRVLTPLQAMTKGEVLQYLIERNALEFTTSCWNAKVDAKGMVHACHQCANCLERDANLQVIRATTKQQPADALSKGDGTSSTMDQ